MRTKPMNQPGLENGDFHLERNGWLAGIRRIESPNRDARPAGDDIRLIVIHNISLPPGEFGGAGVAQLFTNRLDPATHPYFGTIQGLRVSAHFFIRRDGELIQFVPCGERAWHAGVSSWRGRERCNDYSLGIELEGTDDQPFTDIQYAVLAKLVKCLQSAYSIEGLVGHADIAPGRKTDPGPCFDWPRLRGLLGEGQAA